jgi:MFS family permease
MFKALHPNVWILALAQAFIGSAGPLIVFVGSFVGIELADDKSLSTLPVACLILGVSIFTLPIVRLFSHLGRKKGFIVVIGFGVFNALFASYSVYVQSFWLFCLSILLFGISMVASQQFRFAAMESVHPNAAGQAVSTLLLSGLVAAFIGPEIGFLGKDLLEVPYAGAFVLMSLCMLVAVVVLLFYRPVEVTISEQSGDLRPLLTIVKQPVFLASISCAAIGFAVMSFVMTATPISMHVHHHFSVEETKWVIQSHIIAMYLPSFVTGLLIRRFGASKLLYTGILVYFVCVFIGYLDQAYVHYWGALVLLGIGWNFMFVTATTILPQSYQESEKFKVQGLNDFVVFSSQAIASLSAGWVIHSAGWHVLLTITIPLLLLAGAMVLYWQFRERA